MLERLCHLQIRNVFHVEKIRQRCRVLLALDTERGVALRKSHKVLNSISNSFLLREAQPENKIVTPPPNSEINANIYVREHAYISEIEA
jgi:hypothetical protein